MNSYWFDTVMQLGHGVGQREMCSWRDHQQKSGIAICKGVREDPVVTVVSNSLSVLVCPHDFFSSLKKKYETTCLFIENVSGVIRRKKTENRVMEVVDGGREAAVTEVIVSTVVLSPLGFSR